MNWVIPALALVLLTVQGVACIARTGGPRHLRWAGWFTIALVALGLDLYALLLSGAVAISPEFGIVVVQGAGPRNELALLLLGLAVAAAIGWHAVHACTQRSTRFPWLLILGAGVGLLAIRQLHLLNFDPDENALFRAYSYDLWWPPLLIWLVPIGLATLVLLLRRPGVLRLLLSRPKLLHSIVSLAFLIAALSVADIIYFGRIDRTLGLIGLIVASILVVEVGADRPLRAIYRRTTQYLASAREVNRGAPNRNNRLPLFRWIPPIARYFSLIIKGFVAIVLLIILTEFPNAHRMIIQPFRSPADPEPKDLGQIASDFLLKNLGDLQKVVEPEVLLFVGRRGKGKAFQEVVAGVTAEAPDAVLAKGNGLEIGAGIKIPLGLLIAPFQAPIRKWRGTRVIDGSVISDGHNRYTLLARSNTGETWSVPPRSANLTRTEQLDLLTRDLAWKLMITNPSVAAVVSESSEAFKFFNDGMRFWRESEGTVEASHYNALASAIQNFREALLIDSRFASANYHLGLALRRTGLPKAATGAFRASMEASPSFPAPYIALADTLHNFDSYYSRSVAAAILPVARPLKADEREQREQEARARLQQVIHLPTTSQRDRASAYVVLCGAATDAALNDRALRERSYLGYFYCKQAQALYAQLPTTEQLEPEVMSNLAQTLNNLGVLLALNRQTDIRLTAGERRRLGWHCDINTIDEEALQHGRTPARGDRLPRVLWRSPTQRAALAYYNRAKTLAPDDQVILCNAASVAVVLGDRRPMRVLSADPGARLNLGDNYMERAKEYALSAADQKRNFASFYYRLALREYQAAINRAPENLEALNNYAYTFWEWRLRSVTAEVLERPDAHVARLAERYARKALRLAVKGPLEPRQRDTLGEVLMALGRPDEATKELTVAVRSAPSHPDYHEFRWDLALAYLCAGHGNPDSRARVLLDQIRRDEEGREVNPFTLARQPLDLAWELRTCAAISNHPLR